MKNWPRKKLREVGNVKQTLMISLVVRGSVPDPTRQHRYPPYQQAVHDPNHLDTQRWRMVKGSLDLAQSCVALRRIGAPQEARLVQPFLTHRDPLEGT